MANINDALYDYLVTNPKLKALRVKGETILVGTDGEEITSLGGGSGGAGGGSIVYVNAAGDFTATPTDAAQTITITGLPFTLEAKHVMGGSIKKNTSGAVTDVDITSVSVSAGVITLANMEGTFATGDELYVTLIGPDKWYDRAQDSAKQLVQNPEWAHYIDPEHIIDDSNATIDQHYSPEIFMSGYRNMAIQLTGTSSTAGVTFKIYGTLNTAAATPADGDAAPSSDWIDMSTDIFGAATVVLNGTSGIYFVDTNTMVYKYIVQYEPDHVTNETDIFLRKY